MKNNKQTHEQVKIRLKGTVMQKNSKIQKALINDRLRVSKVSWKFRIPIIYNLQ